MNDPIDVGAFWKLLEPVIRVENVRSFHLRLRPDEVPMITLEIMPAEEQARRIVGVLKRFDLVARDDPI